MKTGTSNIILLCVLVFCSQTAYTQNNAIDSLLKVLQTQKEDTNRVNTLNELSKELWYNNKEYAKAMEYSKESLSLSEKINFTKGKATAYQNIGWIYYNQDNYNFSEAMKDFSFALKLRKQVGNKYNIIRSYFAIAVTYYKVGNLPEALKNWYDGLKLSEESGDKDGIARSLIEIGYIYSDQGNYSEALKSYLSCLEVREEMEDKVGVAESHNRIGDIYFKQGNYTKALEKQFTALKIYDQMKNSAPAWGLPTCYYSVGDIFKGKGELYEAAGDRVNAKNNYSEALKNYLASLKIWEENNRKDAVTELHISLGNIYIKLKKKSEAKKYFEKGLLFSTEIKDKVQIKNSYRGLSIIDSIQGNYELAFEHFKKYVLYRDSILNAESIRKSEGYKMQYEFDKKEDQIKLLTTQNKLQTALTKQESQRTSFAFAGIGVVLLTGGYGFYLYRRRRKLQSRQEMLNERLRISRELHDEVGATLSGIAMYSHLTKEQIKSTNTTEVVKSLNIMQQSAGEMVNKLNDIVWFINPDQDTLQKQTQRLEEYATDMAMIKNMQVKVNVQSHIHEHTLPVESRRNIYLFCKEAINNAVKYSNGSLLELNIKEANNILEFSVSDNGKGFDAVMVRRGNGLENMQKRADEIGAKLTLQSKKDEGSMLSMQIRITQ